MEFLIPQHPMDLEGELPPGRLGVAAVTPFDSAGAASAEEVLDGLLERVLNAKDIFATVLDHAVFDQAYSLLKCVREGPPRPAFCPRATRPRLITPPPAPPCTLYARPPLPPPRPGGGRSTAATSSGARWSCCAA